MKNKDKEYRKIQNKRKRKITNPKTKSGKHRISNKNSKVKKLKFKIATLAVALGIASSGILSIKNVKESALNELDNQTAIEERYPDETSEEIENLKIYEISEAHEDLDIYENLKHAELETLIKLIKDFELQQYIDLNIENNLYVVEDSKLALDDYYLYEAVNSPREYFNEYIEVAFALPILNNKNVDKDSHEYKVARDLIIKNAMFLKDHAEQIVKDKLEEAVNSVDKKEMAKDFSTYSKLESAVSEKNEISITREKDLDSDAPILTDYIKYKDGDKNILIAKAGKKAGKSFFSSEKTLIDGIDNSIINTAISRGEILESKQIYDAKMNELDEILNEKINSGELSNEEINELKSKIEKKKEKENEKFSEIITKAANDIEFQNPKRIKLELETGKLVELDTKDKSYKELIKDKTGAYFAKQAFEINKETDEQALDEKQAIEENEIEKDYEYVDDKYIKDQNKGYGILNDEREEEKDKDDPYDIDI